LRPDVLIIGGGAIGLAVAAARRRAVVKDFTLDR
jgi:cation diffusion facilitator CzcD-associated flavoprotein CzcO